jgi:hypothetical protein
MRFLLLPAIALLATLTAPGLASDRHEQAVALAIRSSLLGRAADVNALARALRIDEQRRAGTEATKRLTIGENVEVLALATERPLPTLSEARARLADYPSDPARRAFERIIRRVEPRQALREAAADRRYEQRRRFFNALAAPLAAAAQGEFFPLVSLPFDAAYALFVGRPYATPEERRELRAARDLVTVAGPTTESAAAADRAGRLSEKRRGTAILQAGASARRAEEERRPVAAAFWYTLRDDLIDEPGTPTWRPQREFYAKLSQRNAGERTSISVVDGELTIASAAELRLYGETLRALLAGNAETFAAKAREMRVSHPGSVMIDDVAAAEASLARERGDIDLARVQLAALARISPESNWGRRTPLLLKRPEFDPAHPMESAESLARLRRRLYVWEGRNPAVLDRSLTGEEARLSVGSPIARARGLFITDAISRLLFLPLADPIPRPELLDAGAQADRLWFASEDARRWRERWIRALRSARRHEEAARAWDQYGHPERAVAARHRAARLMERTADALPSPRERHVVYTRILNGYPDYRHRTRVADAAAEARALSLARVTISREELLAWPELAGPQGLALPATLLDGRKSNGEISKTGVSLLPGGIVSYFEENVGRRLELPTETERVDTAIRLLEPRRRADAVTREIRRPMPRKKIPLALEAGIYPGFDIFPGLVPLEPESRQRQLYE